MAFPSDAASSNNPLARHRATRTLLAFAHIRVCLAISLLNVSDSRSNLAPCAATCEASHQAPGPPHPTPLGCPPSCRPQSFEAHRAAPPCWPASQRAPPAAPPAPRSPASARRARCGAARCGAAAILAPCGGAACSQRRLVWLLLLWGGGAGGGHTEPRRGSSAVLGMK